MGTDTHTCTHFSCSGLLGSVSPIPLPEPPATLLLHVVPTQGDIFPKFTSCMPAAPVVPRHRTPPGPHCLAQPGP